MLIWLAAIFVVATGIAVILAREPFARLEGIVAGGTVRPGCVVAQGALLFVLAIVIAILHFHAFL
jgi:hypothetical protein